MPETKDGAFRVTTRIPGRRIFEVLCNGIDQGAINYWGRLTNYAQPLPENATAPEPFYAADIEDDRKRGNPRDPFPAEKAADAIARGGYAVIEEHDESTGETIGTYRINATKIGEALDFLAEHRPKRLEEIASADDDIETADVLIQIAAFGSGEVRYG